MSLCSSARGSGLQGERKHGKIFIRISQCDLSRKVSINYRVLKSISAFHDFKVEPQVRYLQQSDKSDTRSRYSIVLPVRVDSNPRNLTRRVDEHICRDRSNSYGDSKTKEARRSLCSPLVNLMKKDGKPMLPYRLVHTALPSMIHPVGGCSLRCSLLLPLPVRRA